MSSESQSSECIKGCGFFGSSENGNMCSKCYKDHLKVEEMAAVRPAKSLKPLKLEKEEMTAGAVNRCEDCRKKVGLTAGFKCRCGKLLCGMHRFPEQHSCAFDFKDRDRQFLATQVFLVKADKLEHRI